MQREPDVEHRTIRWRGENMGKPLVRTYLRDKDSGKVYTHDAEGEFDRTNPSKDEIGPEPELSHVESQVDQRARAPIKRKPSTLTEREIEIQNAEKHPEIYHGTRILKKFTQDGRDFGDFEGMITNSYRDPEYLEGTKWLWRVEYDEDDGIDEFDLEDLQHYVFDRYVTPKGWDADKAYKRGEVAPPKTTGGVHPAPNRRNKTNSDNDGAKQPEQDHLRGKTDPYSRVTAADLDISKPRDVIWPPKHVKQSSGGLYTTQADNFVDLCDKLGLFPHHRRLYVNWLGKHYGPNATIAPGNTLGARFLVPWEGGKKRRPKLRDGIRFPVPEGASWMQWLHEYDRKQVDHNAERVILNLARATEREAAAHAYAQSSTSCDDYHGGALYTINAANHDPSEPATYKQLLERSSDRAFGVTPTAWVEYMSSQGHKVNASDILPYVDHKTGSIREPRSIKDAMTRPDWPEWKKAIGVEVGQIEKLGVFTKPMSEQCARDEGGIGKPTPLRNILTYKTDGQNRLTRFKSRLVLCGHSKFLQRGRDFFNTYSATPNLTTSRLICFLAAQGWTRLCYDLTTAYLHSPVKDGESQIVIPDPPVRDKQGRLLVCRMLKWQYGHPKSCRRYVQTRNEFYTGEKFNTGPARALIGLSPTERAGKITLGEDGEYHVQKSLYDQVWDGIPNKDYTVSRVAGGDGGLYLFRHHHADGTMDRSFMVCHVDDCDTVGENVKDLEYIKACSKAKFGIKEVNASHMLGLNRILSKDGKTVTVSMEGYVEEMYREHITKENGCNRRIPDTPMPPGTFLSKASVDPTDTGAAARKTAFLKAVGSIAWATRNCFPECAVGVNMMSRQMLAPSEEAMKCAYHMIAYMYGARHQGIVYRKVETPTFIGYYDASNKPDPVDGKAMAGHVLFLGHSPLEWRAQRLPHVGQSAQHNEYMELSRACKATIWLRQLLTEMGFGSWIKEPTVLLGDNDAATTLAHEDIVSLGNRFYTKDIHYSKEQIKNGNIDARRVPTDDNLADGCTKCLDGTVTAVHVPRIKALIPSGIPPAPPARRE
jgi:hypothetical protein